MLEGSYRSPVTYIYSSLQKEFRLLEIIWSTFYSIHPYISAFLYLSLTDPLNAPKYVFIDNFSNIHLLNLFYSITDYKLIYVYKISKISLVSQILSNKINIPETSVCSFVHLIFFDSHNHPMKCAKQVSSHLKIVNTE